MDNQDLINSDKNNKLIVKQTDLTPNPLSENDKFKQNPDMGVIQQQESVQTPEVLSEINIEQPQQNEPSQQTYEEFSKQFSSPAEEDAYGAQQIEKALKGEEVEEWYKDTDLVGLINDLRNNKYISKVLYQNGKYVESNAKDRYYIDYIKALEESDVTDSFFYQNPIRVPSYDYAQGNKVGSFLKGFISNAITGLGGAANVGVRALEFPSSFAGYFMGKVMSTKIGDENTLAKEYTNYLQFNLNKAMEEYLNKQEAQSGNLPLRSEENQDLLPNYGKLSVYSKQDFDRQYARIEDMAIAKANKDEIKSEAFKLFNAVPESQRISEKVLQMVYNQESDIGALKQANAAAWEEFEKRYRETSQSLSWLNEELGLNLQENDNETAAELGAGAFSIALTLSSLFLPGLGYTLPALFTAMTYDESIRHGLDNGLTFKDTAIRSTIPAVISGSLEYLKIVSLINRSKNFKDMFIKTASRFWLDETVQEILQDNAVMASEEMLGLAEYELADYMSTSVQDIIFSTITAVPMNIILQKRLYKITKHFTDLGVNFEDASKFATSIIEYGQGALNNKDFMQEMATSVEKAFVDRKYKRTTSDIDMTEETVFDNPSVSHQRFDNQQKRKQEQQKINEEEQKAQKPEDLGKKPIKRGTYNDFSENNKKMQGLLQGKISAQEVNSKLYQVKKKIKEVFKGSFLVSEDVANALAEIWYSAAHFNFILTNEKVTPSQFVDSILPTIIEGYSNNINNDFEGLSDTVNKNFGGDTAEYIYKDVIDAMSASASTINEGNPLAVKMASMAQYMANILKNKYDNLSDEECIAFSTAYLVSKATNTNINEILVNNNLGHLAFKNALNYIETIHTVAKRNVNKTNGNYLRTQEELSYSYFATNIRGEGIESNFWDYSSQSASLMGATTVDNKTTYNSPFVFQDKKMKNKAQYLSFSSSAMANTYVHEMVHAIVNYTVSMAKYKQANDIELSSYENNLLSVVNNFAKKYDNKLRIQWKNSNSNTSFEQYRAWYLNEFIATAVEYGIMTGRQPDDASPELISILDNIKRMNNSFHYADNAEDLQAFVQGAGGRALQREKQKLNKEILSDKEMEEKDNIKRENVAEATQELAVDPNGDLNPDILNRNGETQEELVAHISGALDVVQKEGIEKIQNINNELDSAEEKLASQLYNLMFKRNSFLAVIKTKQDLISLLDNKDLSNKQKVERMKRIVDGLPNDNTSLSIKLFFYSYVNSKDIDGLSLLLFKQDLDSALQDIALKEAYGIERELAPINTDTNVFGKTLSRLKIFFEDISPERIRPAIDFIPVSDKSKEKFAEIISDISKHLSKGYKETSKLVGKVSKAIDSFVDNAYENNSKFRSIVDGYHKAFTPISDLAKKLNSSLSADIKKAVFAETSLQASLMQPVNELAKQLHNANLSKEERIWFTNLLINQDWANAKEFLKDKKINADLLQQIYIGLQNSYSILREADVFGDEGIGFIKNYFPRIVKNSLGLRNYLDIKNGKVKEEGSDKNKIEVSSTGFGKKKEEQGKHSFMNNRQIKTVPLEATQYYYDALDTLSIYFSTVARIQGFYTMLGKGSYKKINPIYLKKITQEMYDRATGKEKQEIKEQMAISKKILSEAKEMPGNKIEEQDSVYRMQLWGKIIAEMGYSTGSKYKDVMAAKVLDALFLRSNPSGAFTIYRGVNNITTINNIFNALSNLGDLILTTYRYGYKNALYGLGKAAKGKEYATVDIEPLVENLYEEFRMDNYFFNNALQAVFKWSGFKALDLMTKRANLEAALATLKTGKEGEAAYDDTLQRLKDYFNDEIDVMTKMPLWQKTLEEIKRGEETDDVKFFLFNELSGQQPITLAEVPYFYNKYPWTRLFYQFKTFATKQVSFLFNEVIGKKLIENPEKGLKDLFLFFAGLLLLKVPEECLISMIKGEQTNLPDEAVAAIAQFFMINKKAYYKIKNAEFASGVATMAIPMPTVISRIFSDIDAVFTDSHYKAKTLSSVPVVGEPLRVAGKWTGKAYSYWFPAEH